ncbi:syntaxin binding protein [Trypanosoma cruzi]|nr:syntaxin binding protein [Trypanosoma cruzi]
MAKVLHRNAHNFGLGCTPHRSPQQLARARIAPRAMRSKDIMLDFAAREVLVLHLSMQNGFPQLLSPLLPSELMVRCRSCGVTSCGGYSRREQRCACHLPTKQRQHLPWVCQDLF